MRTLLTITMASLAAGCTADAAVESSPLEEAALAVELADMSAGLAQRCVSLRDLGGNRSVGGGTIIFDGRGDTVYVNRPPAGCPSLDNRVLRSRTSTTQLCAGDIVSVFDPVSGSEFGACGLGEFTPYRRSR